MLDNPLLEAFYAAYNRHDAPAAAALYHADGWHEEIAMEGRREGQVALADGLSGLFRMLPDVRWAPGKVIRSADWTAVNYVMTGTFTLRGGKDGEVPGSRQVVLDGLHLIRIRDDRIEGTRDYWDKGAFLAQIG
ncbi:nuclear transport factor 2 family protein [Pseudooceanicola algae]|uniref:SnoaL-like domain-containing protein n=1 Tax=Pseudooceanicola algae TaxID=1537215 RepID=A0A418SIY2_9RHOB|nr:nuclear transport factor 2 family protein [Pseudooceanicola algae]QPM91177.1 hypothetical protein PSAL_024260 [Pseudooceanicola algae]